MSLTAYDGFFGWVHGFKLNRNNYIMGGRFGTNETPYPCIINRPSYVQVINNWNLADTGLVATTFVLGFAIARRRAMKDNLIDSFVERRNDFMRYHRILLGVSVFMAMRNSAYRLEGYVPNGLPRKE